MNCTSGLACPAKFFLKLVYLWITFFASHKARFSRLTSDLPHFMFQLSEFKILSRIELRNVVNTVKVKRAKSKEPGYTDKAWSLSHCALGYQSSLEELLVDIY